MWLLKYDNSRNNMHDFIFDLKNLYASAKAAGFKFPMGTASLMHVLKIADLAAENNEALWELYIAMDQAGRTVIKLTTKQHDQAMLALHNSLIPDAIKDYAKTYYPITAEMVARHLIDNYGNIVVVRNNQRSKKKSTNQSNEEGSSETAAGHV